MRKGIIFLLCAFMLAGCSGNKAVQTPLSGPWLVNMSVPDIGNISLVMTFETGGRDTAGYSFHAWSKKGVDRQVLGWWKAQLGRWFTKDFKYGSLLHIERGQLIHDDSIAGVLTSSLGNFYLNGHIKDGHLACLLSNGDHKAIGRLEADKSLPPLPLRNYTAVMNSAVAITQSKLYDPALLKTDAWKNFATEMDRISRLSDDDATFLLGFFYYSHKYLPFSHYALLRPLRDTQQVAPQGGCVTIKEMPGNVSVMTISSFSGTAGEMDSAFAQVAAKGYKALIVDMRDNPGGNIAPGMAFMRHLIRDSLYGGIFLTNKYFATHSAPPPPAQYSAFPHFSAANYDLIIKGISEQEGICLIGYAQQPVYQGKVYILINGNTASTCEPAIYALQHAGLATLVGETSAGAMLNGEKFSAGEDYELFIPTATYYTADGYKIDKGGVVPDIKIKAARALDTALAMAAHL